MKNRKVYKRKKYSVSEKKAYNRGFFAGLFKGSNKKSFLKNQKNIRRRKKVFNQKELLGMSEHYRKNNLGALSYNGKIYDTNFKGEPYELTKETIKDLREEYDFDGKLSDLEVANRFVRRMRRKYGVFNKKTHEFEGMLSEQNK